MSRKLAFIGFLLLIVVGGLVACGPTSAEFKPVTPAVAASGIYSKSDACIAWGHHEVCDVVELAQDVGLYTINQQRYVVQVKSLPVHTTVTITGYPCFSFWTHDMVDITYQIDESTWGFGSVRVSDLPQPMPEQDPRGGDCIRFYAEEEIVPPVVYLPEGEYPNQYLALQMTQTPAPRPDIHDWAMTQENVSHVSDAVPCTSFERETQHGRFSRVDALPNPYQVVYHPLFGSTWQKAGDTGVYFWDMAVESECYVITYVVQGDGYQSFYMDVFHGQNPHIIISLGAVLSINNP